MLNTVIKNFISVKSELKIVNDNIKLLCVTKNRIFDEFKPLLDYGHKFFGENYIQEAEQKWSIIRDLYNDTQLHLIGLLQSNKVKKAVKYFDVIESIDSMKLYETVKNEMEKQNKTHIKLFFQINISNEGQKNGFQTDELYKILENIKPDGIMCIPKTDENPSMSFVLMNQIAKEFGIQEISMGMSSDYKLAAKLGATEVRIGTTIFGNKVVINE